MHKTFPQHAWYLCFDATSGNSSIQIGHSSLGGGCLKSDSSSSSAARFLHSFLCFDQFALWQVALQYLTSLHAVHAFRPSPSFPHAAQFDIWSSPVLIVKRYCVQRDFKWPGATGGIQRHVWEETTNINGSANANRTKHLREPFVSDYQNTQRHR